MEIAIIEAENLYAVYFNGQMTYYEPEKNRIFVNLSAKDILKKVMELAVEFQVPPTIDNLEYFYLKFDEQYVTLKNAGGVFPEALHEAIKLYGLLE